MSHQVIWTKDTYDFVCEHAMLSDFERELLSTRIAGMTITQQMFYFNRGRTSINDAIKRIKQKYDVVQKQHPEILDPRTDSVYEKYMDEN